MGGSLWVLALPADGAAKHVARALAAMLLISGWVSVARELVCGLCGGLCACRHW